eukprot:scaffold3079_cov119-Cylindrotheca_fusiformis.AAC.26
MEKLKRETIEFIDCYCDQIVYRCHETRRWSINKSPSLQGSDKCKGFGDISSITQKSVQTLIMSSEGHSGPIRNVGLADLLSTAVYWLWPFHHHKSSCSTCLYAKALPSFLV